MFKSVFAKYITTFILIIVICFAMILSIILSLVTDYANSVRTEIVQSAAKSTEAYLELKYEDSEFANFRDFVVGNRNDVFDIINSMATSSDGISIMLADGEGKLVLYATGSNTGFFDGAPLLPEPTRTTLLSGEETHVYGSLSGLFEKAHISYAVPIIGENMEVHGSVIASYSSNSLLVLLQGMIETILASSLWVMVATLIAVYFITEMITGPLREMSKAAKSFAEGKFDVRVPVRGKDEVAELAMAFNNMAQSLENLENMRNTFMANVSHDLRTPMTTISGFIDNILIGAIPKEEQSYYLGVIKEEVRRLSRLVSSLLDISRLQAGDRKFTMTSFDICELARLILISFEQKIDEKQLDVEFLCDDERMFVIADRDAIYQILYNVCDNAVKFAKEKGTYRISIHYAGEDGQETKYDAKIKKVLVSVYNQGQGIAPEDLPYVFERFYKADKSRGLDRSGVGLGMFISKTIIDAHGEKIWVESQNHEWCNFFFTLPRDMQTPPKASQSSSLPNKNNS